MVLTCLGKEEAQILVEEYDENSGFLYVKDVAHYAEHLSNTVILRYFHGLVEGGVDKIDLYLVFHGVE